MPPTNTPIPPQVPPAAPPQIPPASPPPLTPSPMAEPAPRKSKKALIIILISSAVVLLAAAGGVAWWVFNAQKQPAFEAGNAAHQTPDTSDVRNVKWVEPFRIPGTYKKFDDSFDVVQTFTYQDSVLNCSITTDIAPYGVYSHYGKTPRDVALDTQNQDGVTITKNEVGPTYEFKDIDGTHTYQFESMQLDKNLNIKGVNYTKEHTVIAYKPFGVYGVSISFTCKDETWASHKADVEGLAKQFTLRTER